MKIKITSKQLHVAGYIILVLFSVHWTEINMLPKWMILIATLPLLIGDVFSHYNPKILAYIYTHKRRLVGFVLGFSLILSILLYWKYPFHVIYGNLIFDDGFILITQFIVQGAIVGLTIRMLLLNLFADMLRARDIHKAKLLIMAAWIVFLVILPVNQRHISLSPFFMLGFGFGFWFHYLIRIQEKKKTQRNRLKVNIMSMISNLKREDSERTSNEDQDGLKQVKLTSDEEEAVRLYSDQNWKKLKIFLHEHKETTTLFFIRICMLRKLHEYESAIGLISEKIEKPDLPHKNYYHLHYALNESEMFDYKGNWINRDKIFENLEEAHKLNPNCLLTCATLALRIAGEIEFSGENQQEQKDKALKIVWKAMKIYEGEPIQKVIAYATGMTIPVTYTFLLDTYAYVLLKCGKTRFARALILQSLFQDPTFSATYLHLAELYYSYIGGKKDSKKAVNENLRKAAKLNLYVAIEMEKEYDKDKKGTLISTNAKKLLKKI